MKWSLLLNNKEIGLLIQKQVKFNEQLSTKIKGIKNKDLKGILILSDKENIQTMPESKKKKKAIAPWINKYENKIIFLKAI